MKNKWSSIFEQALYSVSNVFLIVYVTHSFSPSDRDIYVFYYFLSIFWSSINASFLFSVVLMFDSSKRWMLDKLGAMVSLVIGFIFLIFLYLKNNDGFYALVIFSQGLYDYQRRRSILLTESSLLGFTVSVALIRVLTFFIDLSPLHLVLSWHLLPVTLSVLVLLKVLWRYKNAKLEKDFIRKYFALNIFGLFSGIFEYLIHYAPGFLLLRYGGHGEASAYALFKNILSPISFIYQYIDTLIFKYIFSIDAGFPSHDVIFKSCIFMLFSCVLGLSFIYTVDLLNFDYIDYIRNEYNINAFVLLLMTYCLYPFVRVLLLMVRKNEGIKSEFYYNFFSLVLCFSIFSYFSPSVSLFGMTASLFVTYFATFFLLILKFMRV